MLVRAGFVGRMGPVGRRGSVTATGTYLPDTPYYVGAVTRQVEGFSGPAVRLVRVSDSVEQDFSFNLDDNNLDLDAIETWAGGSEIAVKSVYDQTGSARALTQSTIANMPRFNLEGENGFPCISNDTPFSGSNSTSRGLRMTGISVERTACTILQVARPYFTVNRCFFQLYTGTTSDLNAQADSTGTLSIGATLPSTALLRSQLSAIALTSSLTEMVALIDDQTFSGLTPTTAKASTGFGINVSVSSSSRLSASDIYCTVIYTEVRADVATIHGNLIDIYGVADARTDRVIYDGDSNTCGYLTNLGKNVSWNHEPSLVPTSDIFNVGTFGLRMTAADTAVATRVGRLARSTDVVVVRYGTNDINNDSTTGAALYALLETYLATLRAVVTPKIVVCTVPPNPVYDATKEGYRTDYNALLRANAVALDVTVADNDSDAVFTAACRANDATLVNGLHYTDLGTATYAALELPAVNTALAL